MAASSPMINNQEDTQTRSSEIKLSKTTPHAALPSRRFKNVAERVIATSTRSTGMHHNIAPASLHPSEPRSFNAGKVRRNSLSDVVACATNGANRTPSEGTTCNNLGITERKDCRNSLSNPTMGSTLQSGLHGKLASGNLASTSGESRAAVGTLKAVAKAAETDKTSHAGIRDSATHHRTHELCKNCKSRISRMESVCFITNDGRISAAPTGALHARHSHHCNMRGCAGNPSYRQPASPSSRRDSLSKKQAPFNPQPTRRKSVHTLSGTGDHRSTPSSVQGDDRIKKQEAESSLRGSSEISMSSTTGSNTLEMKKEIDLKEDLMIKSSEDDDSCMNTSSLCHAPTDQNGSLDAVSPCHEHSSSCSSTRQVRIDQESYVERTHTDNVEAQSSPPTSSISSDTHGDDDDKSSAYRDDIQALNDFQGLISYHGDNEYSCSEGGTDASTTTPISSSKGAFDDLSNIDIEQSHSENEMPRSRRSAFPRITQKYLESLTEQEAEKVRLRKKEMIARKQAGDWMLDGHMGEVLHRLAPTGEAHVKVLVEAFETVMHQSDSDCSQTAHHLDQEHVKTLRQAQASS